MKTRKALLKSPVRAWDDTEREYDALLLVPTGTKHDSGFMLIAVIGVNYPKEAGEDVGYEICSFSDDVSCCFPMREIADQVYPWVRMDCYYPQGVLRYHGDGKFRVGPGLSSVTLHFRPRQAEGPTIIQTGQVASGLRYREIEIGRPGRGKR